MNVNMKRQCIPLLLMLLALSTRALSDDSPPATQPQLSSAPKAVQTYIASAKRDAEKSAPKLKEDWGDDVVIDFEYLFSARAIDFRDGKSRAYLVGYSLGVYPGTCDCSIDKAALIDQKGESIVDLGDYSGYAGIAVQITPKLEAAAFSCEGSSLELHGNAEVISLEKNPKVLLDYGNPGSLRWESTLFFVDTRNRGTKDILIRRIVRDLEKETKWTEYVIFEFDPPSSTFKERKRVTKKDFDGLIQKAGGEKRTPHCEQYDSYDLNFDTTIREVEPPKESK